MKKAGIYAIRDKVAGMLIGGLHVHRHEAAAVRFFQDIATMPDSQIGRHPADFELLEIGYLDDDGNVYKNRDDDTVNLEPVAVLDGATWAAMQKPSQDGAA